MIHPARLQHQITASTLCNDNFNKRKYSINISYIVVLMNPDDARVKYLPGDEISDGNRTVDRLPVGGPLTHLRCSFHDHHHCLLYLIRDSLFPCCVYTRTLWSVLPSAYRLHQHYCWHTSRLEFIRFGATKKCIYSSNTSANTYITTTIINIEISVAIYRSNSGG